MLTVVLGFAPSAGQVFTIIDNDLAVSVSGAFAGRGDGSIVTAGGARFRISHVAGRQRRHAHRDWAAGDGRSVRGSVDRVAGRPR